MDSDYNIHNLKRNRNKGERQLHKVNESKLKLIQTLEYLPKDFDEQWITRDYAIFKSKIFYFYDSLKEPYPDGIMDAEDLIDNQLQAENKDKSTWLRGPFKFEGSNRFYNVYRKNRFETFIKVFYLPDMTERTLMNDF